MINIKKGQYFKGGNDTEYIFLSYKNPNIIYAVDNNFDNTGEIFLFDADFINIVLDKYNDNIKKLNWYYECKEELDNSSLKDKINYLMNNLKHDFRLWENEVNYLNIDIRLKKIGNLVSGKAFYSDQNQFYEVVGFLVETETYKNNKKMESNNGMFAIYHSKCDNQAPMTFFTKKENGKYATKGSNDYFEIENTLISEEEIENYVKQNNIKIPTLSDREEMGICS